ncbi:MAG: hypothetical protein GWN01_06785 [Nitrosopumilaceae archaeon]|nr:hypothetical protein [Nitrosopumilaceae archaeon]NIU87023.1 hypothetical protein [Nitrosopumilaceae archaeon]NIV65609.1 hypothetical protein [Nitrosopumilaceae archaeon]NIX61241.1 hypothetical protein [Nitrosopumilaceae archaeon]
MTKLTIQLKDSDYQKLQRVADNFGKSIQELFLEWIADLPTTAQDYDVTKDPVFQMEGYDSKAPTDFSNNFDKYIYGEDYPK